MVLWIDKSFTPCDEQIANGGINDRTNLNCAGFLNHQQYDRLRKIIHDTCQLHCCYKFGKRISQPHITSQRWRTESRSQFGFPDLQIRSAKKTEESCKVMEGFRWFREASLRTSKLGPCEKTLPFYDFKSSFLVYG